MRERESECKHECVQGLSPLCVYALRCVSQCLRVTTFLCVVRCERLCHSPRACTPLTPSLRETSPHQPPHTRRPLRVTGDRGSRTSSSPRRGRNSTYRPELRVHSVLPPVRPWTHTGPCVGALAPVLGQHFREPPGEGRAWRQPRAPHLLLTRVRFFILSDSMAESLLSFPLGVREHGFTQNDVPSSCRPVLTGVNPPDSPAQARSSLDQPN